MSNKLLYSLQRERGYIRDETWFDRFWNDDIFRIKVVGIIAASILILTGLWYIVIYRAVVTLTIETTQWELKIAREQYMTVAESDWYVPAGGRIDHTNLEIRTWERYKSGSHYETRRGGTYECGTSKKPKTCRYPDKQVEVDDYSTRPVWDTKYYYYIDRWMPIQPLMTSGNDKETVAWPNTDEYEQNPPNVIGKVRLGMRTTHYWITGTASNGKHYSLDMGDTQWRKYWRGSKAKLTLGFFGNVIGVD